MNKIKKIFNLISSMGIKPLAYRAFHVAQKKSGLLKIKYPVTYEEKNFISLDEWRKNAAPFFFNSREDLKTFNISEKNKLKAEFEKIKKGEFNFFHGEYI
ncbi:MAG: hypothetical protein K2X86_18950, partial [Cytophagaceae bacterium]|nr:hypothetical protein [Cytophagaceae bacterium]